MIAACDAPNRSSERGAGSESEERAPVDPAEPEYQDEGTVDEDTTSEGGNMRHESDTIR